jgi:hypothetical protein
MLEGLFGRHALLGVDHEKLADKVAGSLRDVLPKALVECDSALCGFANELVLVV